MCMCVEGGMLLVSLYLIFAIKCYLGWGCSGEMAQHARVLTADTWGPVFAQSAALEKLGLTACLQSQYWARELGDREVPGFKLWGVKTRGCCGCFATSQANQNSCSWARDPISKESGVKWPIRTPGIHICIYAFAHTCAYTPCIPRQRV